MTDNQAMEIAEGPDWKALYMDAQARVVERDQRIHELSSRPTMDAYLAACRALHWHTAQLRANGIEPDPIEPDAPHYPPDGHVFSATPAAGDAEVERVRKAIEAVPYVWVAGGWDEVSGEDVVPTLREFFENTWQGENADAVFDTVARAAVDALKSCMTATA